MQTTDLPLDKDDVAKCLRRLPYVYNQALVTPEVLQTLETIFRNFVCDNDDEMRLLFNILLDADIPSSSLQSSSTYKRFNSDDVSMASTVCGHIFKKGEGVYRCR
jgi:hypothetical protein